MVCSMQHHFGKDTFAKLAAELETILDGAFAIP